MNTRGNLPTGKPDAGNPPVRFGGRGDVKSVIPTPITWRAFSPEERRSRLRVAQPKNVNRPIIRLPDFRKAIVTCRVFTIY